MKSVTYRLHVLWLTITRIFRRTYTANTCGHRTKRAGEITSLGERVLMEMPLEENGNPAHCLDCIASMSIRCACCGGSIHIGEPLKLLHIPPTSGDVSEYAVRYHEGDNQFVIGCLRWECADTGGDRQGFWEMPGRVCRIPSVFERMIASDGKCGIIVIKDLSDRNDHGTCIE